MADQACVIGKQIVIRGNLSGAEDLIIEGRIEGAIKLANRLTVDASGVVEADLEIEDLNVNGVVSGDIQASRSVSINAGARVQGTIRAPRVAIADGACFKGRVEMDFEVPAGVED